MGVESVRSGKILFEIKIYRVWHRTAVRSAVWLMCRKAGDFRTVNRPRKYFDGYGRKVGQSSQADRRVGV